MKVAIIGSAGRQGTHQKITPEIYFELLRQCKVILKDYQPYDLVSGGAAFCDHLAVELYLQGYGESLHLYLPAPFNGKYSETEAGRSSNLYHARVSEKLGRDTLAEIQDALDAGATCSVHSGFMARNAQVAQADLILAFGWESNPTGGTRATLNKAKGKVIYTQI